jgi:hypothetical protein
MMDSYTQEEETRIKNILQPLAYERASADYFYQFKSLLEFTRCFRSLEESYTELYTKILAVEKHIADSKTL